MIPSNRQTDLFQYARAVKRRWYLVLVVVLVIVGAALAVTTRQERRYESSADVLVVAAVTPTEGENTGPEPGRISQNVAMALRSKSVSSAVGQELGFGPATEPEYTVRVLEDTDTLRITATDADPERAALVANAVPDVYSNQVSTQELASFEQQRASVQARIDEINSSIQAFEQQRRDVIDARVAAEAAQAAQQNARLLAGLPIAPGTTVPTDDLFLIDEELRLALSQRESYRDTLSSLTLERDSVSGARLRTLSPAVVPTERAGFGAAQMGVLALVVGVVLGLAAAIVRDRVAGVVADRGDVEDLLAPAPVLAVMPSLARWRRSYLRAVPGRGPRGAAAEAIRSLAVSVRLMSDGRALRVIQVASPRERETSNVAGHLARALASSKRRVVLVNADVRNRARQDIPALGGVAGWTDVVAGRSTVDEVVVDVHERLSIVPVGRAQLSEAELVGDVFGALLRDLERSFDFVVVDSPSLASADALLLTSLVDGTVLVVRVGKTR
ncbi:MAG: hypothetical protein GEV08_10580, partial [Acidimicrobiia bacterium]|nr:hypothetical protein [Acidimicrobiia bacterium]